MLEKKFYRPKEVATYLGISIATLWRYVKVGKIVPIKMSDRITVFDIDELNRFVSSSR